MNTKQLGSAGRAEQGSRRLIVPGKSSLRSALSVAFAILIASALVPAAASAVTAPASDPFYTQPANIAQYPHGTILREREVTLSGATQTEAAAAYQLMYATTNATGQPVAAVTTVMVPTSPALGPRRLASYQTYYDSLTLNCAPSYTLQGGNNGGGTNGPTEQAMMTQLLEQGWDVVTSDYEGLDSEWAVGPMLGYATLDSIIAVEHFALAELEGAKTEVTLNGYSGGSEASTWAAAFAPNYAPSLDIVGVAAGGNFPDLGYTTQNLDNSIWYGTQIGVLESFSRALPQDFDLTKILNASGQALAAKDGQGRQRLRGLDAERAVWERVPVHELPGLRGARRLSAGQERSRGAEPEERPAAEGAAVPLQLGRRRPGVHPAGRHVGCQLLPARGDRRLRPRPGRRRPPQWDRAVLEGHADLSRERVRRGGAPEQLLDLRRRALGGRGETQAGRGARERARIDHRLRDRPGGGRRGHRAGVRSVLHAAGEPRPVSARDDPARAAGDDERSAADRDRGRLPVDVRHD